MNFRWMSGRAKLFATIGIIVLGVTLPLDHWPATAMLAVIVFVGHSIARIPIVGTLRRLTFFLPIVGLLAISIPALEGFERGFGLSALILMRSTLSFLAVIWLTHVLPIPELLATLESLRIPLFLTASLGFMHRYSLVLWHELERMRFARRNRMYCRPTLWQRWSIAGQAIGMLLLRAFDRADRVYLAMIARGWNGLSDPAKPLTENSRLTDQNRIDPGRS